MGVGCRVSPWASVPVEATGVGVPRAAQPGNLNEPMRVLPVSLTSDLEVHGRVPECTIVNRVDLESAIVAPAMGRGVVL